MMRLLYVLEKYGKIKSGTDGKQTHTHTHTGKKHKLKGWFKTNNPGYEFPNSHTHTHTLINIIFERRRRKKENINKFLLF